MLRGASTEVRRSKGSENSPTHTYPTPIYVLYWPQFPNALFRESPPKNGPSKGRWPFARTMRPLKTYNIENPLPQKCERAIASDSGRPCSRGLSRGLRNHAISHNSPRLLSHTRLVLTDLPMHSFYSRSLSGTASGVPSRGEPTLSTQR
jgi:hypothetical protein